MDELIDTAVQMAAKWASGHNSAEVNQTIARRFNLYVFPNPTSLSKHHYCSQSNQEFEEGVAAFLEKRP